MEGTDKVNPQVVSTIDQVQQSTMSAQVLNASGSGKALQSISQSSAIAVQDATDNLRNINTMATTAMGVALSQMLATGNTTTYGEILKQVNEMVKGSTTNFETVGKKASGILEDFSKDFKG